MVCLAAVDLYLMTQLSRTAVLLGVAWLVLGVVYLVVLTRGLRQPPPEFAIDTAEAAVPALAD